MPITADRPIQVMTQEQFGAVAFEVMNHAFAIHHEMGRLFDEEAYRNELLRRLGSRAGKEVILNATFGGFSKSYRMDLLVDGGGVFETKTASDLHDLHRTQLIHYLLMSGLRHGKLINFRREQVQHEFVNCTSTLAERRAFSVQTEHWNRTLPGCGQFQDVLTECLRDWGTRLELQLYEEALTHFFGGPAAVQQEIDISNAGQRLGCHSVRLINPVTAFKLTSFQRDLRAFESQMRRFLQFTRLEHILWANITLHQVLLVVVSKA